MKRTTEQFEKELKLIQSNIKVIGNYINTDTKITVEDKYNILYNVKPYKLLQGKKPSIQSAVDKNLAFEIKARILHGDKYGYSLINYIKSDVKIEIICPVHGVFKQNPYHHLMGKGCEKCGTIKRGKERRLTNQEFINKCQQIHGNEYDYTNTEYIHSKIKVFITCKKHGEFDQAPFNHIGGQGCPKCKKIKISNKARKNSYGWSRTNWIKKNNSKTDSDPQIYIIKCFNFNEKFVKIGMTLNSIKKRYPGKSEMPYNYDVLKIIKGNAGEMFDLEQKIKKFFKKDFYIPIIKFNGMYESYDINKLQKILKFIENEQY